MLTTIFEFINPNFFDLNRSILLIVFAIGYALIQKLNLSTKWIKILAISLLNPSLMVFLLMMLIDYLNTNHVILLF